MQTTYIALCFVTLMIASHAETGYSRLVQQKPLLFGRRGMSPNMNSLFFGKRSSNAEVLQAAYDEEEMCSLCKIVQPTCNVCLKSTLLAMAEDKNGDMVREKTCPCNNECLKVNLFQHFRESFDSYCLPNCDITRHDHTDSSF